MLPGCPLYCAVVCCGVLCQVFNIGNYRRHLVGSGQGNEFFNPNNKEAFEYIQSYSPYDNVDKKDYPHIFVTAGLNDPRVTYWEPAKWVAKLREFKTDSNTIVLKTNLEAGHGGKSGRFENLKEDAEEYAFILAAFDMV